MNSFLAFAVLAAAAVAAGEILTVRRWDDGSSNAVDDAKNGTKKFGFAVDRTRRTFLLDGEPFRYVSGSVHYFRVHPDLWRDRLRKLRAAGFNAVQTYVEWSLHEPRQGAYCFGSSSPWCDLEKYLSVAAEEGLLVILRPGPFIDAERDLGGLPSWLLAEDGKDTKLRTSDPSFLAAADSWLTELYRRVAPLMRHRGGGPVIAVQVENEYGSFGCDVEYLSHLRDLAWKHLGAEAFLFTTDGYDLKQIRCGKIPGVYGTVDFGVGADAEKAFHNQRLYEPDGPLVNSEFYPGWLDHWGEPHHEVPAEQVASALDKMLTMGASVNMYMAHGGTSFGFWAGANEPPFVPQPTSYDYDAPISEAGDLTHKYFVLKSVIAKHLPPPSDARAVSNSTKAGYGDVVMSPAASLADAVAAANGTLGWIRSANPLTFEQLGQAHGFVFYETTVDFLPTQPAMLSVPGTADRGYVFVDGVFAGVLSRWGDVTSMPVSVGRGQTLQILVENQGRICFGPDLADPKGITSAVTLGGTELHDWRMMPMRLEDDFLDEMASIRSGAAAVAVGDVARMHFWSGTFKTPCGEDGRDTFLRLDGWSKGVAWINGFNVGRYWPAVGPQETLYVPSPVVLGRCQENRVLLFEQDGAGCVRAKAGGRPDWSGCKARMVASPDVDGPTPHRD